MPRIPLLVTILLVTLTGCLPYSCRPEASTELMPSDSLSREIAATVPADTIDLVWTAGDRLEYPRTVRFATEDSLFVSDVERDAVLLFDSSGTFLREIATFEVPYIAGIRGDTLAVFSPAGPMVRLYHNGEVVRELAIEDPDRPASALVYAAFGEDLYYKRVGPEGGSFIARVSRNGQLEDRAELKGPYWRYAGLLRASDGRIISLSGFRPVVDVLEGGTAQDPTTLDTLALRGFDSPMLARSRSFVLGDVTEAPLLSSAAAIEDSQLFVVNIRAGWLQIDVFGPDGNLRRRLVQREPGYQKSFFPQDIDVQRRSDGSYRLAVALSEPSPELRLYTWQGLPDSASARQ